MNHIAYKTENSFATFKVPVGAAVFAWTALLFGSVATAGDWMTWPSTYTHEPVRGQRVDQYAQPVQPIARRDPTFQRSGYRNYRSSLQGANSADNMHIVEQWGAPVVPYEQWRFPFRPYGTPYDAWGPQAPYGIFNGNINANIGQPGYFPPHVVPQAGQPNANPGQPPVGPGNFQPGYMHPGYPYPGYPYPGYPYPGNSNQGYPVPSNVPYPPNGFPLSPQYQNQPWYDGTYPTAPPLDNRSDAEFFYKPRQ